MKSLVAGHPIVDELPAGGEAAEPITGALVAIERPDSAKFWYVRDILEGHSDSVADLEGLASLLQSIDGAYSQPAISGSGVTPRIEGQ